MAKTEENISLLEFIEKLDIKLIGWQKEVIKELDKARKEGKEIQIRVTRGSVKSFLKNVCEKYIEEMKEEER